MDILLLIQVVPANLPQPSLSLIVLHSVLIVQAVICNNVQLVLTDILLAEVLAALHLLKMSMDVLSIKTAAPTSVSNAN